MRLSSDSSRVLKELSSSIRSMEESRSIPCLVMEMKSGAQELQAALRSLPKQLSAGGAEETAADGRGKKQRVTVSLMEAMPLITAASLLAEVSERVEGVVEAVSALAALARFEPSDRKKASSSVAPRDESVKPQRQEV